MVVGLLEGVLAPGGLRIHGGVVVDAAEAEREASATGRPFRLRCERRVLPAGDFGLSDREARDLHAAARPLVLAPLRFVAVLDGAHRERPARNHDHARAVRAILDDLVRRHARGEQEPRTQEPSWTPLQTL